MKRRSFLAASGYGLGSIALSALGEQAQSAAGPPARAKNVIMLFMSGAPSQVDTFDPKPTLTRLAGQDVPDSVAATVPKIRRAGLRNLMASPWEFSRHGESGLPVSSLFPETAQVVDELCFIRSMYHRNPVHGPAECLALTGTAVGNRPQFGCMVDLRPGIAERQSARVHHYESAYA